MSMICKVSARCTRGFQRAVEFLVLHGWEAAHMLDCNCQLALACTCCCCCCQRLGPGLGMAGWASDRLLVCLALFSSTPMPVERFWCDSVVAE